MTTYFICPGCGNKVKDNTRSWSWHIKNNPKCATANLQDSIPVANNTEEQQDIVVQQQQQLATDDNDDDQSNNNWENAADDDDILHEIALKGANDKDKVMAGENSNSADDKSIVNLDETSDDSTSDNNQEDEGGDDSSSNDDEEVEVVDATNSYCFNPKKLEGWGCGYLLTRCASNLPGVQGYNFEASAEMQSDVKSDVELLKILKGHDLSLFSKIREWRHNSHFKYKHHMDPATYKTSTRDAAINKIGSKYGLHNLKPKILKVHLPMLEIDTDMVVFNFGESLVSLLTSPEAMDPKNLLIDPIDPFKKPQFGGSDGILDDIDTGSVYVEAHKKYCTGAEDILAGLICFCDKSFVDLKGKLTLEPFMFTLTIFNRKFRNNPASWRPMGYIPNLDHVAPRAAAIKKLKDYHFCLKSIMSEMIEYQKLGGIHWNMLLGNQFKKVRLQIPMFFIIGDTEGHDKMAGRKIDRSSGKNKQCRYCEVDHDKCDDPYDTSELTKKSVIQQLRREDTPASRKELDRLSYRQIDDAFDEVVFADSVRGIHGATPAEVLHAVNVGVEERVIAALFEKKRKSTAEKKRERGDANKKVDANKRKTKGRKTAEEISEEETDNDDGDQHDESEFTGEIYKEPERQKQSKWAIFNKAMCDWVDKQCTALHRQLRWQSDADLPRTNFPTGIASLTKMTGNERTGVLLLLLLVMCIDNTHNLARRGANARAENRNFKRHETGYLVHTIGDLQFQAIVKHISLLLLFEGFLKSTRVPIACMEQVKTFVHAVMEGIFRTFARNDGTGNKTIKSHLVGVHMVQDVGRMGSAENYNSGPSESSHIDNIKVPGRNTQKRASTFAQQCSNHYINNLIIDRAFMDHPNWESGEKPQTRDPVDVSKAWLTITSQKVLWGGPPSNKEADANKRTCIRNKLGEWVGSGIQPDDLVSIVRLKILPHLDTKQVTIHKTMTKEGEQKFQANPHYGGKGKEKMARQHWALAGRKVAKIGGGTKVEEIPVHLQCIVFLPEDPTAPIDFDLETSIKEKGYYFLANTIDRELKDSGKNEQWGENWDHGTLAENNQRIIHLAKKKQIEEGGRDALIVVPTDGILCGLVGVLDPNYSELKDRFYFFIAKHSKWGDMFMEAAIRSFEDNVQGDMVAEQEASS